MERQHNADHMTGGFGTAITVSNTATLSPCYVYVGVSGDVAVVPALQDTSVTFKNVPQGTILPVKVKKVLSTGTTATDMVAVR